MSGFAYGVLCGGRSSRMGRRKEELTLGGKSYLDLAIDRSGGTGVLLSVGDAEISAPGCHSVPDLRPDSGPLGGLEALLAGTEADWLIVSPVDTPLLASSDLGQLRSVAERDRDDAVVMRTAESIHFTIAAYRVATARVAVTAMLDTDTRRLDGLADRLRVRFLDAADPQRFANINTPDDLIAAGGEMPT